MAFAAAPSAEEGGCLLCAGASWCGALDMAGYPEEWVADWYDREYYARSPSENPTGPDSGRFRAARGGDKGGTRIVGPGFVHAAARFQESPAITCGFVPYCQEPDLGFRCAFSAQP